MLRIVKWGARRNYEIYIWRIQQLDMDKISRFFSGYRAYMSNMSRNLSGALWSAGQALR